MSSAREKLLAANKKSVKVAGQYDKEPTRNDEIAATKSPEKKLDVVPPTKTEPHPKSVDTIKEPKQKEKKNPEIKFSQSALQISDETKVKHVNISLPNDVITYLKFKATRTRTPQYVLISSLLNQYVTDVNNKTISFKTPELEQYRIRLVKPMHLGVNISESLLENVQLAASQLAMTPTQFYNYIFTEVMKKDADFEY